LTPLAIIFALAALAMTLERWRPGRALPRSVGWYARAVFFNACQLAIIYLGSLSWERFFQGASFFTLDGALPAPAQGLLAWLIGTFVFYWWHRIRHESTICWRLFHQIHHSPGRIEVLTSFYKHPLEIAANSILASALLYGLLGASFEGAGWFNVFAAAGEFFYHANVRTPHWVGYLMQRPEHHSIHHAQGVHDFNYGDITWWDRLFGTFRDTHGFARRCGFPGRGEHRVAAMLLARDISEPPEQRSAIPHLPATERPAWLRRTTTD